MISFEESRVVSFGLLPISQASSNESSPARIAKGAALAEEQVAVHGPAGRVRPATRIMRLRLFFRIARQPSKKRIKGLMLEEYLGRLNNDMLGA